MSTDLTVYEDSREIADAFMDDVQSGDGLEGNLPYIDCSLKDGDANGRKGICCGIGAKSTTDTSGLAQFKLKLRGGNAIITHSLAVGVIHTLNISRLYPEDANGVRLYY